MKQEMLNVGRFVYNRWLLKLWAGHEHGMTINVTMQFLDVLDILSLILILWS